MHDVCVYFATQSNLTLLNSVSEVHMYQNVPVL